MKSAGEKFFNLERDKKKKSESLNKIIGEKLLKPEKNRRRKPEKKTGIKYLLKGTNQYFTQNDSVDSRSFFT